MEAESRRLHIEFLTTDATRSKRFYGERFGWEFEDIPGADYVNVRTSEDGIEGGIGGVAEALGINPPAPKGMYAYLLAPDMDATLAAIERAGGEIVIARTDVMGMAEFAHFRDPDGTSSASGADLDTDEAPRGVPRLTLGSLPCQPDAAEWSARVYSRVTSIQPL